MKAVLCRSIITASSCVEWSLLKNTKSKGPLGQGGLLKMSGGGQGLTLEGVRRKLKEFHDAIGDEGGAEEAERQRGKVMRLLLELGYEEEAPPLPLPSTEGGPEGPEANGRAGDAGEEEADPFNLDALAETAAPALLAEARQQPDTTASAIHAENGGVTDRYIYFLW